MQSKIFLPQTIHYVSEKNVFNVAVKNRAH